MYRFIYLGLYAEARSGHLKRATRTLNTAEWHGARCLNGGTLAALIAQLDHGFANISRNISRILLRSISRIFSRVRELDSRIREYRPSNSRIRRLEHIQLPSPPSNVPYHCSLSLSLSLSLAPQPPSLASSHRNFSLPFSTHSQVRFTISAASSARYTELVVAR